MESVAASSDNSEVSGPPGKVKAAANAADALATSHEHPKEQGALEDEVHEDEQRLQGQEAYLISC